MEGIELLTFDASYEKDDKNYLIRVRGDAAVNASYSGEMETVKVTLDSSLFSRKCILGGHLIRARKQLHIHSCCFRWHVTRNCRLSQCIFFIGETWGADSTLCGIVILRTSPSSRLRQLVAGRCI